MANPTQDDPQDAPLNPALKSTTETVYDTRNPSPPPIDTTSASEGEGEGWPVIWLVVTVVGIAIAAYLLV